MKFKQLLKQNHLSIYMLAKKANIPYMTINDLVNGRTNFANMSLKNAIAISKVLKMDVYSLMEIEDARFKNFRYFRNTVLSALKRDSVDLFIQKLISEKQIGNYYNNGLISQALYLIALLDYLCRISGKPLYLDKYKRCRKKKLEKPLFVGGDIIHFDTIDEAEETLKIKVIPEFADFNIIESDVFNVA